VSTHKAVTRLTELTHSYQRKRFGISLPFEKSTLHCRGKHGRYIKIGQTNQKMIRFVPNMYVSGKISALRPGTQTVMIFGTTKKTENYLKQGDFRICVFLRFFFCGFYPYSRLMRCKHVLAFVSPSPKTWNQSPKIEDQSSIYRCFG